MARSVGQHDATAEALLAFSRIKLGQIHEPQQEVERLSRVQKPDHRALAELWLLIGNKDQAAKHALEAYDWGWADGEPSVHRYELTKTIEILRRLDVPIPNLPPYDPTKDEKLPWEDEVRAAIEKLRAEKEAEENTPPEGKE
jgi:hypothetical protein